MKNYILSKINLVGLTALEDCNYSMHFYQNWSKSTEENVFTILLKNAQSYFFCTTTKAGAYGFNYQDKISP